MSSADGNPEMKHSELQEGEPPQKSNLTTFLCKLGLLEFYPKKLSLRSLLEIKNGAVLEKEVESLEDIPLAYLRKLLMVNTKCRNHTSVQKSDDDGDSDDDDEDEEVNLLDLVTALYLCADSFLQQEMSIKMSMCQFAVPFLLPEFGDNPCTLMVWALRKIHKEWRPYALLETRSYIEDSVVHAQIPILSFVRLKDCSFSKSQFINQILSNSQQSMHFFTHRDMNGGNVPKEIANGLVEIFWCLPCGQSNIDVFPEPVAIANMRGDISSNETQFRFLMQVSAAVFVLLDSVTEEEEKLLDLQDPLKSKLFVVVNSKTEKHHVTSIDTLNLPKNHVLVWKRKLNMAKFSSQVIGTIKLILKECKDTVNIEQMSDAAISFGLSVDECKNMASQSSKMSADKMIKGIEVGQTLEYKCKQLPLQGEYLKKLAQIEIEECRLQNVGDLSLEIYKAQLQEKKRTLREQQGSMKMSEAMTQFILALSTPDKENRTFFLKWMALKLDRKSHNHLSELRRKFKEASQGKDSQSTTELDQQLMDNSLGIEHYMREMAQIYESKQSENTKHLPSVAAELLLDGYPIELLDGDASNIPEKWVNDVLMEVHNKVGSSRLLVVSVLGVQSTGKSTLLNIMFGVQFPVSSGRCTRGAYMLFLSVGKDVREELKRDFILLIDTEGLKAPELAGLDCSYEHDNQLATLVIGLSDVTIINIAMENSTEMKDVLQIAVHAFLRMKQLGKKPICQFVHQNVSGISAHSKLMTDRKHLLDQLNEMTKIAAEMENQSEVKEFTDVLDYDVEKNNWYVPGLWHGTPPMAPVNSGYSEAVHQIKQNLLKPTNKGNLSEIPDFLKWMSSLWNGVKHENFIFSFRNTLVAFAYDNLCKEFSGWEWSFRKSIYTWMNNAETQISNADTSKIQSVADDLQLDGLKIISDQTAEMKKNLNEYYKRRDRYVNLVERYKAEFQITIKSLENEMTKYVENKLQCSVSLRKDMERVENIHKQHTDVIEQKVRELLIICKEQKTQLSDCDLEEAFQKMWSDVTRGISSLKERDISSSVMRQLRANLAHRNVQQELAKIVDLTRCGIGDFQVKMTHITARTIVFNVFKKNRTSDIQAVANNIIQICKELVEQIVSTNRDYQDNYSKELLEEIDADLKTIKKKTNTSFEVDLKVHICGFAAKRFLKMHQKFLSDKSPAAHLERSKMQYLSDFIDSYRQRDQCRRKAKDLTQLCIKPAVLEYINKSLGIEIVDGILASNQSSQYSSRSYFQYTILTELLEKDSFHSFLKYISKYKIFVRKWIYNQVVEWLSKDMGLLKLKCNVLKTIMKKITVTIEVVQREVNNPSDTGMAKVFTEKLCHALNNKIALPMNTVRGVLFQMSCKTRPFIDSLLQSLDDLSKQLEREFAESPDIKDTLSKLTVKPQNVIFKRVFGCGEQCPFCMIPCEAGGKAHTQHHATVHRPQGLAGFVYRQTQILDEKLCTTCVHSNVVFQNDETNSEFHPFKDYHVYYPDWIIAPDPSIQASDYWKYVLVRYNDKFADNYDAKPAICPDEWYSITKEKALEGLKVAFNVKQVCKKTITE